MNDSHLAELLAEREAISLSRPSLGRILPRRSRCRGRWSRDSPAFGDRPIELLLRPLATALRPFGPGRGAPGRHQPDPPRATSSLPCRGSPRHTPDMLRVRRRRTNSRRCGCPARRPRATIVATPSGRLPRQPRPDRRPRRWSRSRAPDGSLCGAALGCHTHLSVGAQAELRAMQTQAARIDAVWNRSRRADKRLIAEYRVLRAQVRVRPRRHVADRGEDASQRVQALETTLHFPYSRVAELMTASNLWVAIDYVVPNRGSGFAGNQVDLAAGTRSFFGLDPTRQPRNTMLGSIRISYRGRSAVRHTRSPVPASRLLRQWAGR